MEYIKLLFGLALTIAFIWLLIKNGRQSGFLKALFRFDSILGIVAGLYLVFTSAFSLLAY